MYCNLHIICDPKTGEYLGSNIDCVRCQHNKSDTKQTGGVDCIKMTPGRYEKDKKFEEIKRMAFDFFKDIYIAALKNGEANSDDNISLILRSAWQRSETFYNFAKQKEKQDG